MRARNHLDISARWDGDKGCGSITIKNGEYGEAETDEVNIFCNDLSYMKAYCEYHKIELLERVGVA